MFIHSLFGVFGFGLFFLKKRNKAKNTKKKQKKRAKTPKTGRKKADRLWALRSKVERERAQTVR